MVLVETVRIIVIVAGGSVGTGRTAAFTFRELITTRAVMPGLVHFEAARMGEGIFGEPDISKVFFTQIAFD